MLRWVVLLVLSTASLFALQPQPAPDHALSLKEAEDLAIDNNYNILASKQAVVAAYQQYMVQVGGWWPAITGTGYTSKTSSTNGATTQKFWNASNITFTQQMVDIPLHEQVKVARLNLEAAKVTLAGLVNDILLSVRQAYYTVALDLKQIDTQKANIELYGYLIKEEQQRVSVGTAVNYDVKQADVALANALPGFYSAIQKWKTDLNQLATVLGIDPNNSPQIDVTEKKLPIWHIPLIAQKIDQVASCTREALKDPDLKEEFIFQQCQMKQAVSPQVFSAEEIIAFDDQAIQYRPDILLANTNTEIADANIYLANSAYYPQLSAVANWGNNNLVFTTWTQTTFEQPYSWEGHLALTWTFFNGFSREHQAKAARATKRQTNMVYQQTLLQAYQDIKDRIYDIEQGIFSYLSASNSFEVASDTIEDTKQRLELGLLKVIDYRRAVEDFTTASITLNEAQYGLLNAYYELRHSLGIDVDIDTLTGCLY